MKLPAGMQGIGIPFFKEPEWLKAKQAMEDGHTFHATYSDFLQAIENGERRVRAQGVPTIRVDINVDAFVSWCRATGRKVNAEARSAYAAIHAMESDRKRD